MKNILFLIIILFLISCSEENRLITIKKEHPEVSSFIDSIIANDINVKECHNCKLSGYDSNYIHGTTPSDIRATLYYNNKKQIGKINYISFSCYKNESENFAFSNLYFCFLNDKQLDIFKNFSPFYISQLTRHKQPTKINFYGNIALIEIQNLP